MGQDFKIGDLVRGKEGSGYGYTNENSVCGVVRFIGNDMYVKLLECEFDDEIGNKFVVKKSKMELIHPKYEEKNVGKYSLIQSEEEITITDGEGDVITLSKEDFNKIHKEISK